MPLPTLEIGLEGWALRVWHEGDAAKLAEHANNSKIWRKISDGFPHLYTLQVAQHCACEGHVDSGGHNLALVLDRVAVGGAGVHQEEASFDAIPRSATGWPKLFGVGAWPRRWQPS